MSGFEIAGIVLGAFPLLVSGFKELQELAEGLSFYKNYRRRFDEFLAQVEVQSIAFDQVLEILLDISGLAENHGKLSGSTTEDWAQPQLAEALKQRFRTRQYEWLTQKLGAMRDALESLNEGIAHHKVGGSNPTHFECLQLH